LTKDHSQGRCAFDAKFAMENNDLLFTPISARRRRRLDKLPEEHVFNSRGRIKVDGARNVTAFVLIIEAAVDDNKV
jgi:hypothetical protein